MKKIKLIYNPFSGEGKILKYLDKIIELFQENGYSIIPFRISKNIELNEAFKDIFISEYSFVIGAGGDGTINQIVNAMIELNIDLPLAILPIGTANDFAKLIEMPDNIEDACLKIINGTTNNVDLGKVNDKYFINVFSFGAFTDISQKTPTIQKNILGKLAYYVNGVKELPTLKFLNIDIESLEFSYSGTALIVFVFNGQTAGNINIAYKSKINDGLLDIIIVKKDNLKNTFSSILDFLRGEHLENSVDFIHFQSKNLKITHNGVEDITTDIDGECGPLFPLEISCISNKFKIIY